MVKKSRTLIFLIILISFLLLTGIVEAQDQSIGGFFKKAAETIKGWAELVAGVAFGFCAILIATSGGNPGRLAQAKEALVYIAVGLLVVELGVLFVIPSGDIAKGLEGIAKILGKVAAMAGGIYLAYGIYEFAVSSGDPVKLDQAKTAIMWGVIGAAFGTAVATGAFAGITKAKNVAEKIVEIFGVAAAAMGAVSLSLGVYKIATSGGDPKTLSEGKTNIIWGAVGIAIGTGIMTVLSQFGISF